MKLLLIWFSLFITIAFSQENTFKLKDGTVIVGEIMEETDSTISVLTKFGLVAIDKNLTL